MDPTLIARIAHEADRTLAAVNGDMTVGGWPNLQAWQRTSLVTAVLLAIATPGASAEALHESWRHDKIAAGWTQGPRLDIAAKADPLLLPWTLLTPLQRRREHLFLATVRSLSPNSEAGHMDNAAALTAGLQGLGAFLSLLLHALFVAAQPMLNVAVPLGLTYLFHRHLRSKAAADALTDLAGTAYLNLGTQYATNGTISFAAAKRIAVDSAVAGMNSVTKAALAHMDAVQVAGGVHSQLGKLLASDPVFDVTDPRGTTAALAAATLAATATPAPATDPATPAVQLTPGVNFDITALVTDAVRKGIAASQTAATPA